MREPLLFIPGMMCDAQRFQPQIEHFSRTHNVMVACTTEGERIEEIASTILSDAPQKFALAGLSMGGIIAMEILRRAPERDANLLDGHQSAGGNATVGGRV